MQTASVEARKMTLISVIILAAITIAQASEAFLVQGLPSLAPFIQTEFNLNKAALGAVMSAVYTGLTCSSIAWGWVIDNIGVRKTLLIGLLILGVFASIAGTVGTVSLLYPCLFVAGVGFASVYPATTKAVMYWAPAAVRGTFMGIKQTGVTAGGALSAIILPGLALALGWRSALSRTGIVVILMGVLCYVLYREHPLERAGKGKQDGKKRGEVMLALLKSPNVWKCNLASLCLQTCQVCTTSWMLLYLKNDMMWSVVAAGSVLAMVQSGGMAGRLLLPMISDALTRGRRKPVLTGVLLVQSLSLLVLSLLSSGTAPWLVYLQAAMMGFVVMGWVPLMTVLRAEIAGKEATGTITTIGSTINSLGSILGPPAFGLIVDTTGSFRLAWRVLLVVSVLGLMLSYSVNESQHMFEDEKAPA